MVEINPMTGGVFYVKYGEETYFGSGDGVTIDQSLGIVTNCGITETNATIESLKLGGGRNVNKHLAGQFGVAGPIDFELQDGKFFKYAFGTLVESGSDPYFHYLSAGNTLNSLQIEVGDTTSETRRVFSGMKINSFTLSASVGNIVTVSADFMGRSVTLYDSGASAPTLSDKDPFVYYEGDVYIQDERVTTVNSWSYTLNNNLVPKDYVTSTDKRLVKAIVEGLIRHEASLEMDFEDTTIYKYFLGAAGATTPQGSLSGFDIKLTLTRSSGTDQMTIWLRNCRFDDNNINPTPNDVVGETHAVRVVQADIEVIDSTSSY